MRVTKLDRLYYARVVDSLLDALQISDTFSEIDGMDKLPLPAERIMNKLIISFKEWLISEEGADWLSRLGYYKMTDEGRLISYDLQISCDNCKTIINKTEAIVCENCNRVICAKCSEVVDTKYDIRWCINCI
jgi:hypothetical protein